MTDPKDEALKAIDALIEFGDHTHDCYYYKGGQCDCGRDEAVERGMKVRQQLIGASEPTTETPWTFAEHTRAVGGDHLKCCFDGGFEAGRRSK